MNVEYEKRVGQALRKFREARGLTQEELSAKFQTNGCDLTRSAIAKIEVGQRHIYPDEIKLFAEILAIPYEKIFL